MIPRNMNKKSLSSLAATAFVLIVSMSASAWAMAPHNADPNAPPPPAWVQWGPMIALFAIFYFLMIRPQSKQRKERENMLSSLKKGDRIVTQSGFIVTIVSVGPKTLEVKLADEARVQMMKSGVSEVVPAGDEAALAASSK
jgi:preprotein translocase subunit YajC